MSAECEHHEILISAFLDDDLGRPEELELLDHLAACPSCREFYRDARAVGALARAADPVAVAPAPPGLWAGIASASSPGLRPRAPWWLPVAALLVIALGVGFVVASGGRSGRPAGLPSEVRVDLGSRDMTEARFLEITREVLESDRRYQRAMLQVMDEVLSTVPASEGGGDDPENGETDGERPRGVA